HTSLMEEAKKEKDIVVASIFVNPLQYGPNEDYEAYPRDENHDRLSAEQAGIDILFIPDVGEMYPNQLMITMGTQDRVNVLCGKSRPGHFAGVITVLTKLFHIVQPDNVYFGMKDAQQIAVVSALINDLNFPMQLIGLPTIREQDGLAKSSRNVRLHNNERKEAVAVSSALQYGKRLIVDGELNPDMIVQEIKNKISNETTGII